MLPVMWTNWATNAVKVVIIDDDSSSKMSSVQGYTVAILSIWPHRLQRKMNFLSKSKDKSGPKPESCQQYKGDVHKWSRGVFRFFGHPSPCHAFYSDYPGPEELGEQSCPPNFCIPIYWVTQTPFSAYLVFMYPRILICFLGPCYLLHPSWFLETLPPYIFAWCHLWRVPRVPS